MQSALTYYNVKERPYDAPHSPKCDKPKAESFDSAFGVLQYYFCSFCRSFLRISTRLTLPLMVLGSSSTNSTILGYL